MQLATPYLCTTLCGKGVAARHTECPVPTMAPYASNQTRRARSWLTGNVLCSTCPVLSNTSTREQAASLCCAPAATLLVASLLGIPVAFACLLGSAASMLEGMRQCS